MGNPVVHFEIIGPDPTALRRYYGELFGWSFDTPSHVVKEVSAGDQYGFYTPTEAPSGAGIPGGIGGGQGYAARASFYVGVPDVEAALKSAERLGGKRVMGPAKNPNGKLVVGHFTDPAGNLIGVAGPK
jgi:uncharacterized protein